MTWADYESDQLFFVSIYKSNLFTNSTYSFSVSIQKSAFTPYPDFLHLQEPSGFEARKKQIWCKDWCLLIFTPFVRKK